MIITGTDLDDRLTGTADADTIDGRAGNDRLFGGGGSDQVSGGRGSDTVDGGLGDDVISFADLSTPDGNGRVVVDLLVGLAWSGSDVDSLVAVESVAGTSGDDWIKGNDAVNTLSGGAGGDVLVAYGGGDTLIGEGGNDALYGTDRDEVLISGEGIDWVEAGGGNDLLIEDATIAGEWSALHGGGGEDEAVISGNGAVGVWGGDGNDTIRLASLGSVYVTGGAGADSYMLQSSGLTQIYDFELGLDKIYVLALPSPERSLEILDWGPNTGVLLTDGETGAVSTVMLMGIASSLVDVARDFIL